MIDVPSRVDMALPLLRRTLLPNLCLRGGANTHEDDGVPSLRDLLNRRNSQEPSILDLILGSFGRFPPSTAAFMVANLVIYLAARVGLLGRDPAASFGMRTDRMLLAPRQESYRMLTGQFLHLSHSHVLSNMLYMITIGSKLERHLGTARFAGIIAVLVPLVGVTNIALTVLVNLVASTLGVKDHGEAAQRNFAHIREQSIWSRALEHQSSTSTTSIGFSGVLFALNAIGSKLLDGDSMVCLDLAQLPRDVQEQLVEAWGALTERPLQRHWCIPAEFSPLLQVITSQLADPLRVSLCGHLAGAVAAMLLQRPRWLLASAPVLGLLLVMGRGALQPRGVGGGTDWRAGLRAGRNVVVIGGQKLLRKIAGVTLQRSTRPQSSSSTGEDARGGWGSGRSRWEARIRVGDGVRVVGVGLDRSLVGLQGLVTVVDEVKDTHRVKLGYPVSREVSVAGHNLRKVT